MQLSATTVAVAAVLVAGAISAMQPVVNGRLGVLLGSPLHAGLTNFVVGAGVLFVLILVTRQAWPSATAMASVPPHLWLLGGALGACIVTSLLWGAPKVGAGAVLALLIAAQLVSALGGAHFGLCGREPRPVTFERATGAALAAFGALMVSRG